MKPGKIVVSFLLMLSFALLFLNYKEAKSPVEIVREDFVQGLDEFYAETERLIEAVRSLDEGQESLAALQYQFMATRTSFKRIEFLIDYLQPQDVKDFINGAPLLKTERSVPRVIVLEPKGMQVIEELLYSDHPLGEKTKLLKLCKDLNTQTLLIKNYQYRQPLYDRQVFEAARLGLIRIMSLGVTGFDTPGSGNALSESAVAFSAIHNSLRPYLSIAQNQDIQESLSTILAQGEAWLHNQQDFDSFDHAYFIREFIEPAYGLVKDLQKYLHIETMDEVLIGESTFNYDADHIFSKDFLNPYFYTVVYEDLDNPELTELGRLLFFDPILSKDMKRSCSSCHNPKKGFSDGRRKSLAFHEEGSVDRNAPGLINSIYSEKFFYDLRADKMENQIEHVIFNQKEFRTNYKTIFSRLEQSEEYRERFQKAFKGQKAGGINKYTLSAAIASYIASLRGYNTALDLYLRGESNQIDPKVKEGFNLFMGKAACATCHFAPTFAGLVPPFFEENESEVLGVFTAPLSDTLDPDLGRLASGRLADEADFYKYSFKTVSVRNVALTAPYFHNGAYKDLFEVVEFYNHGGAAGRGVELPNQTLPSDSLGLKESEIEALVVFMKSLTDTTGLTSSPAELPVFAIPEWSARIPGGEY
jgi:cytochrome c peroxidase